MKSKQIIALSFGIFLGFAGSRAFVTAPTPTPTPAPAPRQGNTPEKESIGLLGPRTRVSGTVEEVLEKRLANDTPEAVIKWLESLPRSQGHYAVEDYIREPWPYRTHTILSLAEALPPGATKYGAAQGGVGQLAHRDPQAAIAWAETHLEGELLDLAFGNIVSAWASTHPAAASDWVESRIGLRITDRLLLPLIRPLAGQDPARAWKLASQIRDSLQREKVVLGAIAVLGAAGPCCRHSRNFYTPDR